MSKAEVYTIEEMCGKFNCSDSTLRRKIKNKMLPVPMRRRNKQEPLRWHKSAIDKFLRISPENIERQIVQRSESFALDSSTIDVIRLIVREEISRVVDATPYRG